MSAYTLQVGDLIRVSRFLHSHVGIYVGGQNVVHNDKGGGVVVLGTLAQFSGGRLIQLHKAATGNTFERQAIANRAFALLGRKFNLWTFNCEHAATWAQSGKAESPQLQGFAVFALLILGLGLLARNK